MEYDNSRFYISCIVPHHVTGVTQYEPPCSLWQHTRCLRLHQMLEEISVLREE